MGGTPQTLMPPSKVADATLAAPALAKASDVTGSQPGSVRAWPCAGPFGQSTQSRIPSFAADAKTSPLSPMARLWMAPEWPLNVEAGFDSAGKMAAGAALLTARADGGAAVKTNGI